MKIGFIGAQGTGKTTLLNAVHEILPHFKKCTESTRWVKSLGFDINELGTDLTQELILMKHLDNLFLNDEMLTDRTLIDCFVYTEWLYENGKVSLETLNKTRAAMDKLLYNYDMIFYLPIEFEVEDDGVRSVNDSFRKEIDTKFKTIVDTLGIPSLTGSIEERTQQVINFINTRETGA